MKTKDIEVDDVVALLRLLHFVREEAHRLGLGETAELLEIQAASCREEAGSTLGVHVGEDLRALGPTRSTTH